MNTTHLYEDKKFTSWNIDRVVAVLCDAWKELNPRLEKGVVAYEKKITQISFKGEVNVALKIMRRRHPEKGLIQMYFGLSLSPVPNDLKTHVLNTLDMGIVIDLFPELEGKDCFTIAKNEPWSGSLLLQASQSMQSVIKAMLRFESCFHLLLDDEYEVGGIKLNSKSLSLSHHLNQVKAYRLAEIYGHPEKLDEAIEAIKRFARLDEITNERLMTLYAKDPKNDANWLYTTEFLERLQTSKT